MKILGFIAISISFLPMIFVESSFAVARIENNNVAKLTLLQKFDDVIKEEKSLGKNQERIQELTNAREQYQETLETIERMRNKITLLNNKIEAQNNLQNSASVNNKQRDAQSIYTIQTGSFVNMEQAQRQFDSLIQILNREDKRYLRIEKIGNIYSVRVGSFNGYTAAKRFLLAMKLQLKTAFILKAFIKEDRIIHPQKDFIFSAH